MSSVPAILYRDADLVVASKPAGWLVHRGWARDGEILMTRVRDAIDQWVYPVHRLDRGASGCVVFALSPEAARALGAAFATRAVTKRYLALVRGVPAERGVIDHPIPRQPGGERVLAVTEYERLAVAGLHDHAALPSAPSSLREQGSGLGRRYSLVEARPLTGRLHQIRRHLKHIACPLIGDVRYGKGEHNRLFREKHDLHRLALHALAITVPHPATGAPTTVAAPIPDDLERTFAALFGEGINRRLRACPR
jgi:tRNA pseudouridine65 synthase